LHRSDIEDQFWSWTQLAEANLNVQVERLLLADCSRSQLVANSKHRKRKTHTGSGLRKESSKYQSAHDRADCPNCQWAKRDWHRSDHQSGEQPNPEKAESADDRT